jgi:hypothetical protein
MASANEEILLMNSSEKAARAKLRVGSDMSIADISDQEILDAVGSWGGHGCMTYVARNILSYEHKNLMTSSVLRRLKKMEKQGRVKRVKSCYSVQICWAVVDQKESASEQTNR